MAMHPARKQRLMLVLLLVLGVSAAMALVMSALNENMNLFYTPTQIANGEAPQGSRIRGGGLVVPGSVVRATDSLRAEFSVTDGAEQVTVVYTGILPDLFAEGEGIVATGQLDSQGVFLASEVLAKHDETYMPPEVADALEQSGVEQPKAHPKSISIGAANQSDAVPATNNY